MDHSHVVISGIEPTQIDDQGCIWVSGFLADWTQVHERDITVVVDLEGDIDHGVPTTSDRMLYVYLPFHDAMLPNLERLQSVASLVAGMAASGQRVLCHCGAGLNRSPLVAGLALVAMGLSPGDAVELIRRRRPGALYNEHFLQYLLAQQAPSRP
jgi:protein-tyrosine phosphatase